MRQVLLLLLVTVSACSRSDLRYAAAYPSFHDNEANETQKGVLDMALKYANTQGECSPSIQQDLKFAQTQHTTLSGCAIAYWSTLTAVNDEIRDPKKLKAGYCIVPYLKDKRLAFALVPNEVAETISYSPEIAEWDSARKQ